MKLPKYNIWNKWDPLEVCMLGNNYAPEFFDGLNTKAESPLKRICEETLEDLHGFKTILQGFGVEVIQPELDSTERFVDNPSSYPRGPLQPRDNQIVLGNRAWSDQGDHPAIFNCLEKYGDIEYVSSAAMLNENDYDIVAGADYPSYDDYKNNYKNESFFQPKVWQELQEDYKKVFWLSSAVSFPLGKRIDIGYTGSTEDFQTAYDPTELFTTVNFLPMEGHSDGNYHPIKPGAILSLHDVQTYEKMFPGWDVCYLQDQSWRKVKGFRDLKKKNAGKWWLAGEEDNDEFTHFVETWLQDWVGYVEETVFDVNVLMLDEHHCCVSNPNNEKVNAFLKKHSVEPVYVPWRHRYFWDGGLHCITLDLYREGTQKEYFS